MVDGSYQTKHQMGLISDGPSNLGNVLIICHGQTSFINVKALMSHSSFYVLFVLV